jgi:hypothetical protein
MRKFIAILGTVLIAAVIIISGSAVAPWVDHVEISTNCTNPDWAVGAPDLWHATVGQNPSTLGELLLDLDAGNEMGASQLFTVYGFDNIDNINETYTLTIFNNDFSASYGPYYGWDSADLDFYTPAFPLSPEWRFYGIIGTSGRIDFTNHVDTIYGPEINAVGWI